MKCLPSTWWGFVLICNLMVDEFFGIFNFPQHQLLYVLSCALPHAMLSLNLLCGISKFCCVSLLFWGSFLGKK